MKELVYFIKQNIVMTIAMVLALITSVLVPPDRHYLEYFDFKTLACLFCVLAVVCAFKNINFFYILAKSILKVFRSTRYAVLALVYITFIGSMLIANDMALLTFLPLGYFVLTSTDNRKYMAFTFTMQNIAANLGGMLTPFGNPQNLYLYTRFNIPNGEFMSIMFPPFVISIVLITLCCFFVENKPIRVEEDIIRLPVLKTVVYSLLFALSVAIIFRTIPYGWGIVIITLVLGIMDRHALRMVDYPLLMTFVFFFVFSGNLSRVEPVQRLFSYLLSKSTLIFSTLSCQFISNVPSAILLSRFTDNYRELLLGVNIGGVGTLIASLASLITFREYTLHNPGKAKSYILQFSALNFMFLAVLLVFMIFM